MGKWDENKKLKLDSLLNTSFELFTSQGINQTSISDIVKKAGVAKGTFYLYFKDKYDIRNRLIARKSNQLFGVAYEELLKEELHSVEDKIIFMMKHILIELSNNHMLLSLIYKDLSWALFKEAMTTNIDDSETDFLRIITEMFEESEVKYRNPELMMFLIVEMVSSAGYSSIIYKQPQPLDELMPELEYAVRGIMKTYEIK
ncbi:TetR/AcrR family transcriptional regulator [Butyrivibrio sp. INlla16]|uniref:TetR/AcrR family transcriptional regulator n=1 Tax=Butyrivibrio sp. INlla16 TaxID=1520807 RepID=UPI0008897DBD|nr:TetR/AcrR family transcriptional regulator [Butyrivibrio sp. INlla16]SDB09520.1 transcriptional regulator, TetR family [Butyrivibrio sp. INlla16]